jgi:hypothetical protein
LDRLFDPKLRGEGLNLQITGFSRFKTAVRFDPWIVGGGDLRRIQNGVHKWHLASERIRHEGAYIGYLDGYIEQ